MKIFKIIKFLSCIIVVLMLQSCWDPIPDRFFITNISSETIGVYLGEVDKSLGGSLYPDTTLWEDNKNALIFIEKNNKYAYDFFSYLIDEDTLSLFILSQDTINKYSWEKIKETYNILARYDLDMTDGALRKYDFEFTYPPNEKMKNIQMYPPYSSYEK